MTLQLFFRAILDMKTVEFGFCCNYTKCSLKCLFGSIILIFASVNLLAYSILTYDTLPRYAAIEVVKDVKDLFVSNSRYLRTANASSCNVESKLTIHMLAGRPSMQHPGNDNALGASSKYISIIPYRPPVVKVSNNTD